MFPQTLTLQVTLPTKLFRHKALVFVFVFRKILLGMADAEGKETVHADGLYCDLGTFHVFEVGPGFHRNRLSRFRVRAWKRPPN